MFQMQMDNVAVHGARVFEDNRTDRRIAAPIPRLLIRTPGRAQGVHSVCPSRIGAYPLGEGTVCTECGEPLPGRMEAMS